MLLLLQTVGQEAAQAVAHVKTVEESVGEHAAIAVLIIAALLGLLAFFVRTWISRVDADVERVDAHNSRQDEALGRLREAVITHSEIPHLNLEGRDILTRTSQTAARVEHSVGALHNELRLHIKDEQDDREKVRIENERAHQAIIERLVRVEAKVGNGRHRR
jgi:hypothetical protein